MINLPILDRSHAAGLNAAALDRDRVLARIHERLASARTTLRAAIQRRQLYFRVSVVASCNLSCKFCHNEGAPTRGKMSPEHAEKAVAAAVDVGFTRVQFTGGEPLLHPKIGEFVTRARAMVEDVGVTTNGTYLESALPSLLEGRIHRIHISLQMESLEEAGADGLWGIPAWLAPALDYARKGRYKLRLNLPVPAHRIAAAAQFLELLIPMGCDIQAFSILPEGETAAVAFPIGELEAVVATASERRRQMGSPSKVLLRGYRPPVGMRCSSCLDRDRCKEQSHSLRLGADNILRPCLATRAWDSPLDPLAMQDTIRDAALLALDYAWPELDIHHDGLRNATAASHGGQLSEDH